MQIAPFIIREDEERHTTLDAQTQAVERAIHIMHSHMHEGLTLEDLAAVAYLSPFHFTRVFRRLIGVPPGEFLSALRFQAARHLLLTTPLSVTDICFRAWPMASIFCGPPLFPLLETCIRLSCPARGCCLATT